MTNQECNPQEIKICVDKKGETTIKPLPSFANASSGKATVAVGDTPLTGKEAGQVVRWSKVDYDMVQNEFNQTQSLIKSESDETQIKLDNIIALLGSIDNKLDGLTVLTDVSSKLSTMITLLENIPNNV